MLLCLVLLSLAVFCPILPVPSSFSLPLSPCCLSRPVCFNSSTGGSRPLHAAAPHSFLLLLLLLLLVLLPLLLFCCYLVMKSQATGPAPHTAAFLLLRGWQLKADKQQKEPATQQGRSQDSMRPLKTRQARGGPGGRKRAQRAPVPVSANGRIRSEGGRERRRKER